MWFMTRLLGACGAFQVASVSIFVNSCWPEVRVDAMFKVIDGGGREGKEGWRGRERGGGGGEEVCC